MLSMAPIAAVVIALGAGASGLATGNPQLAAAGAMTGAAGVALSEAANRSARRRHRTERSAMRSQLRDLEAAVAQLSRKLDGVSAVLHPEPASLPVSAPAPQVAAAQVAGPVTPHALPILTANRRGLQSCAPDLPGLPVTATGSLPLPAPAGVAPSEAEKTPEPAYAAAGPDTPVVGGPTVGAPGGGLGALGLPGQRPPATPISGLALSPLVLPALSRLTPGPSDRLGPDRQVRTPSMAELEVVTRTGSLDLAMIASAASERGAHPSGDSRSATALVVRTAVAQSVRSVEQPVLGAAVIDLRSAPDMLEVAEKPSTVHEVRFVTEERAEERSAVRPPVARVADPAAREALFSPRNWPGASGLPAEEWGRPSGVDADIAELRRLASTGRTASRAMRSSVPPSPYFTPGAFDPEASTGF